MMYNDFWGMFERSGWIDAYLLYRGIFPHSREFDSEFGEELSTFIDSRADGGIEGGRDIQKLAD